MKKNFCFTTQIEHYPFKNLEVFNPKVITLEAQPHDLCQRAWITINELEFVVYLMGDNMNKIINAEEVFRGKFKDIEGLTPDAEKFIEDNQSIIYAN